MLPAEQCLIPDFFRDCNLISNFTTQKKSPLGIIILDSHCLACRTVQRWALEMKFTPSATPTHTLAFPAELATAQFATHLKAGLELVVQNTSFFTSGHAWKRGSLHKVSSDHKKVLMVSCVATAALLLSPVWFVFSTLHVRHLFQTRRH